MIAPIAPVRHSQRRGALWQRREKPFVRQAQIAMVPAFCTAMPRTGH